MDLILTFFLLFLGLFIGSFLGVIVDRVPRGESIIRGRSHCESCKKSLGVWDLLPVVSFLFLKGRCRYCHAGLSWFYPIIEITTGIAFLLVAMHFGDSFISLLFYLFIISCLIIIFFTDLKYGIIPFLVAFPAIMISAIYLALTSPYLVVTSVLAAIGAFLFFLSLFLLTRGKGMGFGDVVYAFLMGLLLGFPGIVLGLYIAFVSGAIISLLLIWLKKKKLKGSTVPFGPFLVLGTFIMVFWGEYMTQLVLRYLTK